MVPNPRPIVQEIYIAHVVKEILNVLKDVWNNPAFNSNLARSLNEGTYQSTRINSNMTATDLWMKGLEILEDELLTNSDENESLDRDSSNINIMDKKENELDMKVR
ncbi:1688_t:CDS:2 [Entrophospora sp. SA101]|nr:1688_t:CDS:2 [Entrophospora sp. SA101]